MIPTIMTPPERVRKHFMYSFVSEDAYLYSADAKVFSMQSE